MEVILRENVPHLGQRGDVVRVADGYARNFLIPKQLAYKVTPGIERQVQAEHRAAERREEQAAEMAQELQEKIRELQVIRFQRRVGSGDTLYGSVASQDIADALTEQGIDINRRQVRLDNPIKTVGTHHVMIHLHGENEVELAVEVEPQEEAG
jgi:large subunit ribosomal protein L9